MFGLGFDIPTLAVRLRRGASGTDWDSQVSALPGLLAWYDPKDLTTLFQDAAGTTPVTSDGDPVGLMLDKSENGHHMAQTTAAARPTYETDGSHHWVSFDGVNDSFAATAFAWGSDEATVSMAVAKLSDATPGCLFETSENANNNDGTLALFAPNAQTGVGNYEFRAKGSGSSAYLGASGYTVPGTAILTGVASLSAELGSFFVDGVNKVLDANVPDPTVFGNHAIYLGRRANNSLPFHGRLYGAVLSNSLATAQELLQIEGWMGTRISNVV